MDNEDYEPLLVELGIGHYDLAGNFQYGPEPYVDLDECFESMIDPDDPDPFE